MEEREGGVLGSLCLKSLLLCYQGIGTVNMSRLILSFPQVEIPSNLLESSSCKHFNIENFKASDEKYNFVEIFSGDTLVSHGKMLEIMGCLESHAKITVHYSRSIDRTEAENEMKLCGILLVEFIEKGEVIKIEGIRF